MNQFASPSSRSSSDNTVTLSGRAGDTPMVNPPWWYPAVQLSRSVLRHIDLPLLIGLLALIGCSLVVLASADNFGTEFYKQIIWLCAGGIGMLVIAQIPPTWLYRWAAPLFLLSLILLILVPFIGLTINGSQRWLDLGVARLQPAELVKITTAIAVAAWFQFRPSPPSLLAVLGAFAIVAIPFFLILVQPDLGTSLLVLAIGVFAVFLAGLPPWLVTSLVIAIAIAITSFIGLVYLDILTLETMKELLVNDLGILREYQFKRIATAFDPESDPQGAGYQVIQSRIAIGSGGLFGKGWLNGDQTHLAFLPYRTTDFIFPVLAEEFGFVGTLPVFTLYLFLVCRGLYIGAVAQDVFGRILAGALALSFFSHIFVNIGMVSGLLPVVGVPLPLMSYGGTSLVTILAGFGVLMSIHKHRRALQSD